MGWESDQEAVEVKADRSRWMLWGVVVLVIAMIAIVFLTSTPSRAESTARVSHILKTFDKRDGDARNQAYDALMAVKRQINEGTDFATMAKEHSDDGTNSGRGGDLGWVVRGDLVEEFDDHIWGMELGEVSEPIETPFGFHLILVTERIISDAELYDRSLNQRVLERNQEQ